MLLRLSVLLLVIGPLTALVTEAPAQSLRPRNSPYLELRGGLSAYGGEYDSDTPFASEHISWVGAGELGFQFSPGFALGLAYSFGEYQGTIPPVESSPDNQRGSAFPEEGEEWYTGRWAVALTARVLPFGRPPLSPYFRFGGALAEGLDRAGATGPGDTEFELAYGPLFGVGLDYKFARRWALVLEAQGIVTFPDHAFDDRDEVPFDDDEADFDWFGHLTGGLRFTFKPFTVDLDATIECPDALVVGEAGTFNATVNEDADGPLTFAWDFSDGTTADGLAATHAFRRPGTYTVTFTASGPTSRARRTCNVRVTPPTPPPIDPPILTDCLVRPAEAGVGEPVRFSATVAGTEPIELRYDFGDGATAEGREATHRYDEAGTYTATLTATNAAGTDRCTFDVRITLRCPEVVELNVVTFDYGASTLDARAHERLSENAEVLRRCPELDVRIEGYTACDEADAATLSQDRAEAVETYYVDEASLDAGRFEARGLGLAPEAVDATCKHGGETANRRAESIPQPRR